MQNIFLQFPAILLIYKKPVYFLLQGDVLICLDKSTWDASVRLLQAAIGNFYSIFQNTQVSGV